MHALYIHSLDIGNMASMAPRGIKTVVAVIPVTQGHGGMTLWTGNSNANDFMYQVYPEDKLRDPHQLRRHSERSIWSLDTSPRCRSKTSVTAAINFS